MNERKPKPVLLPFEVHLELSKYRFAMMVSGRYGNFIPYHMAVKDLLFEARKLNKFEGAGDVIKPTLPPGPSMDTQDSQDTNVSNVSDASDVTNVSKDAIDRSAVLPDAKDKNSLNEFAY